MTFWPNDVPSSLSLVPLLVFSFSQSFVHVLFLQLSSFPFKRLQKYLSFSARNKVLHSLLRLCCFIIIFQEGKGQFLSHLCYACGRKRWRCIILCAFKPSLDPTLLFSFKRCVMYWGAHLGVHLCLCKIQWSTGCNAAGLLSCVTRCFSVVFQ